MRIIDIKSKVKEILSDFVREDYDALYKKDIKKLMSSDDIKEVIEDYGGKVNNSSDEILDKMYIYFMDIDTIKVLHDLVIDGNVSDLTLCVILYQRDTGDYDYSLADIHIM